MQRFFFFLVCLGWTMQMAWAQVDSAAINGKLIDIINSDDLIYQINNGQEIQRLKGNVIIFHEGTYFYCDSATNYVSENTLKAYSNVKVEMPNQVTLTSQKLIYSGNTKIAEAIGKAQVTDGQAVLSSDKLTFLRNENYGQYTTGGKLTNADNVLTSKFGYYYPNEKMAYFKKNVKLVSPDYTLTTDTLGYNTETKTAVFMTLTKVESKDGNFVTEKGTYETESRKLLLESRTQMQNDKYKMEADYTNYNNETKTAIMKGKVFIQEKDKSFTLYADSAHYNKETGKGHVNQNVVLIQKDSSAILTAKAADFFREQDSAVAWGEILIRKKDSSMLINSDSVFFNNKADRATVLGNVVMRKKDSSMVIYSEKGHFYNKADSAAVLGNVVIDQRENKFMVYADSAGFNNKTNKGTADGKVILQQKDSTLTLFGGHALFFQDTKETWLSRNPLSMQRFDKDTLYIRADTLYAKEDTLTQKRLFKAYHKMEMYMKDLQGRADSMVYRYSDSLIVLYRKPILWSDSSQLSGDTIAVYLRLKKIDSLWVSGGAFLVSQEDTVGFNQIKGKQIRSKFQDNKLQKMHVLGNAESIYYIRDDKKGYQGMNQSVSQEMKIFMKENRAARIQFISQPEAKYYPTYEVLFKEQKLEGMEWRIQERPNKPQNLPSHPHPTAPPAGS